MVRTVASTGGYAGFHWLILIDPATNNTVKTITADYSNESYSYVFTDVAVGDYLLLAGTDSDNDNLLCDKGEACGGYPLLGQLGTISIVDTDLTNINFATGFNFNLGANQASSSAAQGGFTKQVGKAFAP